MARMVTMQQRHTIGSGNGVLFIGPVGGVNPDTWPDYSNLQEVGSLEGDAEVTVDRGYLNITDGQPQVLVRKDSTAESARISCVTKERRLEQIAMALGFDSSKATWSAADSSAVVNDERKRLFDTAWAHLMGYRLTAQSVEVTSLDATPVTYTEGVNADYVIDYNAGMIRRTANSNIANGETVKLSYTWNRPGHRMMKFGSSIDVKEVSLVFIFHEPEGGHRVIYVFPRAIASEALQDSFRNGNLNTRNMSFDAVFEPTSTEGEGLYWVIHEGELSTSYSEELPVVGEALPPGPRPTHVVSSSPAQNLEGWAIDSIGLTVTFNGPLNVHDAENQMFYTLTEVGSENPVAIDSVIYNDQTFAVIVMAKFNFAYNTWYRLWISRGIMDAGGNPIEDYTLEFRTQVQP